MVSITYTIPDEKLEEFKLGFLKEYPNKEKDGEDLIYTDNEWIKEWGKRKFFGAYRNGKNKILAEGDASVDGDIIE